MSYLDRLKADFSEKPIPNELTKPTKAPSVSFVSAPSKQNSEIEGAANDPVDPAVEARRQRVLGMLGAHPEARYSVLTDSESDPEAVILALAIRGRATCELHVPRDKYDGLLLLDLIGRYGGTVH